MTHTFLVEIGLEEIPAHVVTPSAQQLTERVSSFLREKRLSFENIETFSTPRRLAVKVLNLADQQANIEEEAKGPAKKIAQDAEGNWSKAAIGFSRGQGMTPDDIFFKELKGVEYAYVNKFIAGKKAFEVLSDIKTAITSMVFPTMMRWGSNDFKFVRPLKWIVALLDDEVIPFNILDVKTANISQGHRFLGKSVTLKNAADYPEDLLPEYVIADSQVRKNLIVQQIKDMATKNDWQIIVDDDLLEEVNNLVEYPTVFAGNFDYKYLEIPDEVLITSMKDHQRFFYVQDKAGKLLPNFVSVRNGVADNIDTVIAGNEKVLTARLEDAAFFFHEDQKNSIADYVEHLKKVMFHDKIGTTFEKMQRVQLLSELLANYLEFDEEHKSDLKRAAQIYKFDLVTGMVGEFSELQGVMGEKYALLMGEKAEVATAIKEHYMPISAEGELPKTAVGALLAVADKLDSISAFFAAGMIPTGSNDPYALRRQAAGIARIVMAQGWSLSAVQLFEIVEKNATKNPELYQKIMPNETETEVTSFIVERIKKILEAQNYNFDVIETVTAERKNGFKEMIDAAEILKNHSGDEDFKETVEATTRVLRLAKKADLPADFKLNSELFENNAEKVFSSKVAEIERKSFYNAEEIFQQLRTMRSVINAYFDETMVMAKDENIRNNRLQQLSLYAEFAYKLGDLTKLNVK
ncbi:glycine--tRNA ligase subunit beta [Liquorilactobacillus hordei]|uniref:Glycine--tRNA ligase beta subunit n=1 Tax=Liquorilactobacillus hordei TaxID=468911 RepID=A0A3S6QPF7_9LACO|nr:glycine--tRNA ligase subunit beta [Liquorilactobacillus hordei]AUJ29873.1 glycine--tRNA ligase subunit beta [Liquorilactobacillus hordei]